MINLFFRKTKEEKLLEDKEFLIFVRDELETKSKRLKLKTKMNDIELIKVNRELNSIENKLKGGENN